MDFILILILLQLKYVEKKCVTEMINHNSFRLLLIIIPHLVRFIMKTKGITHGIYCT